MILTRFTVAKFPSPAVDTEEASFAVELCWAFDHFVLRARPMLTENVDYYVEQWLSARFRCTKGEKDCKSDSFGFGIFCGM